MKYHKQKRTVSYRAVRFCCALKMLHDKAMRIEAYNSSHESATEKRLPARGKKSGKCHSKQGIACTHYAAF